MVHTKAPLGLDEKPIVIIIAFPAPGHTNSCIAIAEYLSKNHFRVYFVGGTEFGTSIKDAGAEFIENTWTFDHEKVEARKGLQGPDLHMFDFKRVFLDSIPRAFGAVKQCLETVQERHQGRQIIIIQESSSMGLLPYLMGAPLPSGYKALPKIINFHPTFNIMLSKDVFPFGPGLTPPTTEDGRAQVAAMNDGTRAFFLSASEYANAILKPLGATEELDNMLDQLMLAGDVTVLPYSSSLDYPRSDLHPQIRFLGLMPLKGVDPAFVAPTWLEELRNNAALPLTSPDRKTVVFVSQGTVATNYEDLLLPALEALSERSDTRVVATLGKRGTEIPSALSGYKNAIVVDYIPYDTVLPVSNIFITNAGFGGFAHGVMNGVPMVMCGASQDKAEVCARAEMAGLAVNLRTQHPTVEEIIDGVEKMLLRSSYKQRAMEVKNENEAMDPLGSIENIIWSLVE